MKSTTGTDSGLQPFPLRLAPRYILPCKLRAVVLFRNEVASQSVLYSLFIAAKGTHGAARIRALGRAASTIATGIRRRRERGAVVGVGRHRLLISSHQLCPRVNLLDLWFIWPVRSDDSPPVPSAIYLRQLQLQIDDEITREKETIQVPSLFRFNGGKLALCMRCHSDKHVPAQQDVQIVKSCTRV